MMKRRQSVSRGRSTILRKEDSGELGNSANIIIIIIVINLTNLHKEGPVVYHSKK